MMWSSSLAMGRQILVSSAYSAMSVPAFRLEGRSLMKRTKRIGPRIEPLGTPDSTGKLGDLQFSITTDCSLLRR